MEKLRVPPRHSIRLKVNHYMISTVGRIHTYYRCGKVTDTLFRTQKNTRGVNAPRVFCAFFTTFLIIGNLPIAQLQNHIDISIHQTIMGSHQNGDLFINHDLPE